MSDDRRPLAVLIDGARRIELHEAAIIKVGDVVIELRPMVTMRTSDVQGGDLLEAIRRSVRM